MSARPVYSIVAPVYNEAGNLRRFRDEVALALDSTGESWELLLVDDGSTDGSKEIMLQLAAADSRLSVIGLARNFGHQIAVTAGVDYARGKAVILIDADLQDPPAVIPRLIDKWKEGFQVVYAVRSERRGESFWKRFTAKLFYRMIHRITDIDIPVHTGISVDASRCRTTCCANARAPSLRARLTSWCLSRPASSMFGRGAGRKPSILA